MSFVPATDTVYFSRYFRSGDNWTPPSVDELSTMIQLVGDADDYVKRLFDEVPLHFFPLWLKYMADAYRQSVISAMDYMEPEGRDVLGVIRRARCEEALVNASIEAGLTCIPERNKRRTSSHRVTVAGSFVLVQCHLTSPGEMVRPAEHRGDYADPAQVHLLLDGFRSSLPVPAEESGLAILQHGADPRVQGKVGFAVVNFPSANVDKYLSSVDLLRRFADDPLVAETRTPGDLNLPPREQPDTGEDA